MKEKVEILKIYTNIWAMVAAALFAAVFFNDAYFSGTALGAYSTYMAVDCTKKWVRAEDSHD
ncbi:MAG: hypothetical protein IK079_05905 [Desulfovibrio sp.]|nr:hypothetical protein [Desulfovibrio sp.]